MLLSLSLLLLPALLLLLLLRRRRRRLLPLLLSCFFCYCACLVHTRVSHALPVSRAVLRRAMLSLDLQERILKGEYGEEGEHFTYSYGLVFMNRFLGFLFSAVMLHYTRPKW